MKRTITVIATSLLAASAWAQTAGQPLNLKLPASSDLPAAASTTAPPAAANAATQSVAASAPQASAGARAPGTPTAGSNAPGVYYGDTSGRLGDSQSAMTAAPAQACDDSTYNQPQMHGSVGMGVVSASHMGSGSFEGGNVNITQNLGSCDHPTGSIGVSIGVSRFGTFGH